MPTFLAVKNNAQSTLDGAINNVVTSLDVQTGEGANFPTDAKCPFHISIDDEILEVTAVSSDTFTITRGSEGTTAASHSDGTAVELLITAQVVEELQDTLQGIINGDFRVAQRGTSFTSATTPANSDDNYLLDRWILLSDGNDIVDVTQETTTVPTGAYAAIKLEVETANKQFGKLQILEAKDSAQFIGDVASLSFKARMAASDDNTHSLKAVVLAWDGTADSVTSDVVSSWAASPTYATNWTAENTPTSNTLTTSYQTFKEENISIDTSGAVNVAVFIFCDQTDGAVDDAVYIADVKLEPGAVATPFKHRPIMLEIALSQRYYEKSYDMGTAPATDTNTGRDLDIGWGGNCAVGDYKSFVIPFKVYKRTTPTISYWDVVEAANKVTILSASLAQNHGETATVTGFERGINVLLQSVAVTDRGVSLQWAADAEL